jgi:hypothetical protein
VLGTDADAVRRRRDQLGAVKLRNGRLAFEVEAVRAAARERGRQLPRWFPPDPVTAARQARRRVLLERLGSGVVAAAVVAFLAAALWSSQGPSPVTVAARPTTEPTYGPTVTFTYVTTTCSDGWPSQSIGRRGACSHHGGVVSVFRGDNGLELRCGGDTGPPQAGYEQQRQYRDFGELHCT